MSDTVSAATAPTTAAGELRRPRFTSLVRGELMKVRRQKMTWLLALVIAVFIGLAALIVVVAWNQRGAPHRPADVFSEELQLMAQGVSWGCGILALLVSARAVAEDFHHGTVRLFLARGVGRLQFLAVKLTASAVVAALALLAASLVAAVVGAALLGVLEGGLGVLGSLPAWVWGDSLLTLAAAAVSMVACVSIGFAAAGIGRTMVFGITAAVVALPADNLVNQLLTPLGGVFAWAKVLGTYQLGFNLNSMTAAFEWATGGHRAPVSAGHALIVTGVYVAVLLAVPFVLIKQRDVHE